MIILMNKDKNLLITKKNTIYKYETGVDFIKFLIPQEYKGLNMSDLSCIALVMLENTKEPKDSEKRKTGLFKFVTYDEELYKNYLSATIPITTALTKEAYDVKLWLMLIKRQENNDSIAENVLETGYAHFNIEDTGSEATSTSDNFDEVWSHTGIDELKYEVEGLSNKVNVLSDDKADTIQIGENNNLILKSGDNVLSEIQLRDDVKWEEWK